MLKIWWRETKKALKAGDYFDFQAEMDVLAALSNCPQKNNLCNSGGLKPLQVIHYMPEQGFPKKRMHAAFSNSPRSWRK